MSLFTKETNTPSAQWRYTNATDADARAVQAMYWAKELGYDNGVYLKRQRRWEITSGMACTISTSSKLEVQQMEAQAQVLGRMRVII